MKTSIQTLATCLLVTVSMAALAKLPAPSPEAKAKADEAAARTAWTNKVDTYKLCKSQDQVADSYYKAAKTAGKETKPAAASPPCAEPGPFAYTPAESKPIEASGAHSPAGTAVSPPSTKQPDSAINPVKK